MAHVSYVFDEALPKDEHIYEVICGSNVILRTKNHEESKKLVRLLNEFRNANDSLSKELEKVISLYNINKFNPEKNPYASAKNIFSLLEEVKDVIS